MDLLIGAAQAVAGDISKKELVFDLDPITGERSSIDKETGLAIIRAIPFIKVDEVISADKYWWCNAARIEEVFKFIADTIVNHANDAFNEYDAVKFTATYKYNSGQTWVNNLKIIFNHTARTFGEVGDYEDTTDGKWVRTDADKIYSIGSDFCAVELVKSKSVKKGDWDSSLGKTDMEFVVFKPSENPYDGMKVIPNSAILPKGIVLRDCVCKKGYNCNEENSYTLNVAGDVTIEAEVPIISNEMVIINGEPGSKLTLKTYAFGQPCIGPVTRTGMSGGRWSPEGYCPVEIVIDGVDVICESKEEAFTIGKYGTNEMPKITLVNGGRLICPEMAGTRIVTHQASAPDGSTKISDSMGYAIIRDGDTPLTIMSDETKALLSELCRYDSSLMEKVSFTTSARALQKALDILKLNPRASIEPLVCGKYENRLMEVSCAIILNLSTSEVSFSEEAMFEADKIRALCSKLIGIQGNFRTVWNIIYYMWNHVVKDEYAVRVMYEMIPAYDHNFNHDISKADNVSKYVSTYETDYLDRSVQELIMLHEDTIARHFGIMWEEY